MPARAAWLLLLGCALPALAQQTPGDLEVLQRYAGTWAADCASSNGTRLVIDTKALTLRANGKQLSTAAPITAFSCFGKMPPPAGFDVALLGEARPIGLALLAMKDTAGPYFTVDVDAPLEQRFGAAALSGKFRRCD